MHRVLIGYIVKAMHNPNQALTGDLQHFSIWNRTLTGYEIAKLYRDGYPSLEEAPQVTLAEENCERHGRIQFVSSKSNLNIQIKI